MGEMPEGVSSTGPPASAFERFACEVSSGNPVGVVDAAAALVATIGFGAHPGRIPAVLHEAYLSWPEADPATRARLAAALTRAWVYGGEAVRAAEFGPEAERLARVSGDPVVIADALDAALLVRWGPDDLAERRRLTAMLVDVAGHVVDVEARLSAHLWRYTTAWESLDMVAVQRQLTALDRLAAESRSSRAAFFARSRRAMAALATGTVVAAAELVEQTARLAPEVDAPDAMAVTHELRAALARRTGDRAALAEEAPAFGDYGEQEGIASIIAESAVFWLEAGEPDRAERAARLVAGDGFDAVARDVDFLLTTASVTWVASALGLTELTEQGFALLAPYAGRSVLNGGAVTFHGVVDDYLYRAERALGAVGTSPWRDAAVAAYRRIGAQWWLDGLDMARERPAAPQPDRIAARGGERTLCLYQQRSGVWSVGDETDPVQLPDQRGLRYLRTLLANPGTDIEAAQLAAVAAGRPGVTVDQPDLGEVLDRRAITAYRQRLAELDSDIDEARSWNDTARLEACEAEREALLDELRGAVALGGRRRKVGSSDERARVAVRKAIAASLERLEGFDASLARLLRETVHTGRLCTYTPDPDRPVRWVLDAN